MQLALKGTKMPTFSIAIDATKVPQLLQFSRKYCAILGGAAPDHFVEVPPNVSKEELIALLDPKGKTLASEVKVAVATFQCVPKGTCPYIILAGRPQKKNENSSFNDDCLQACLEYAKDNNHVLFLNSANDGVSCDSEFVRSAITDFLSGAIDHPAHQKVRSWTKSIIISVIHRILSFIHCIL